MPSVIFCTGFTLPEALRKVVAEDPRHVYLPKPIQAETLIQAAEQGAPFCEMCDRQRSKAA